MTGPLPTPSRRRPGEVQVEQQQRVLHDPLQLGQERHGLGTVADPVINRQRDAHDVGNDDLVVADYRLTNGRGDRQDSRLGAD